MEAKDNHGERGKQTAQTSPATWTSVLKRSSLLSLSLPFAAAISLSLSAFLIFFSWKKILRRTASASSSSEESKSSAQLDDIFFPSEILSKCEGPREDEDSMGDEEIQHHESKEEEKEKEKGATGFYDNEERIESLFRETFVRDDYQNELSGGFRRSDDKFCPAFEQQQFFPQHRRHSEASQEVSFSLKEVSGSGGGGGGGIGNKLRERVYDEFLADPCVSPAMKSKVARAKAVLQKLRST